MSEADGTRLGRSESAGQGSNRGQSLSLGYTSGHRRPFVGASVHAATGEQRPNTLHYLEAE
jgi:hypothetical protein